MKKIPENVILVLKSAVPLVGIVVLFFILSQIGYGKINEVRAQIAAAKHEEKILAEKFNLLQTVSVTGIQDANTVTNALPDSNPALVTMTQIKNLAASRNLVVRSLRSGVVNESQGDIANITLNFKLIGTISDLYGLMVEINSFAPITILDFVKISQTGGSILAEVRVKTFWSALPTQLPTSIEEFKELTLEEREVLNNLGNLTQPQYISLPPPNDDTKPDPFAQ